MNVSFVKWVSLSSLGALALVGGLYLTIPGTLEGEVTTPVAKAKGDYSRTLYGVPKLKMDHYRLSEDEYFDLQIEGVLNVGRTDPAEMPIWKERVDKLKEANPTKNKKGIKNAYYKNLDLQTMIYDVIEVKKAEDAVDEVKQAADKLTEASKNADGSLAEAEKAVQGTGTLKDGTDNANSGGTVTDGSAVAPTDGTQGATGATGTTGATGNTGNVQGATGATQGTAGTQAGTTGTTQGTTGTQAGTDANTVATPDGSTSGTVNMGETKNVTPVAPSNN